VWRRAHRRACACAGFIWGLHGAHLGFYGMILEVSRCVFDVLHEFQGFRLRLYSKILKTCKVIAGYPEVFINKQELHYGAPISKCVHYISVFMYMVDSTTNSKTYIITSSVCLLNNMRRRESA
jgi:hypothetical protein